MDARRLTQPGEKALCPRLQRSADKERHSDTKEAGVDSHSYKRRDKQ